MRHFRKMSHFTCVFCIEAARDKQRQLVVEELVVSEQRYYESLHSLDEKFIASKVFRNM